MTETEVVEYISLLFAAYGIGWVSGYLILTFKKLMEYI